jgi:hypothetical protein
MTSNNPKVLFSLSLCYPLNVNRQVQPFLIQKPGVQVLLNFEYTAMRFFVFGPYLLEQKIINRLHRFLLA